MLQKIKELDTLKRRDDNNIVEWESKSGVRYRYDRLMKRVGVETKVGFGVQEHTWFAHGIENLTNAKQAVFHAINEDEF